MFDPESHPEKNAQTHVFASNSADLNEIKALDP